MKADYIYIDGKKVRVEANWNALTSFLTAKGADSMQGLSNLAQLQPSDIAALLAACANEGERLDGREADYDAMKIGEVCGMTEIGEFIAIYVRQTSPKLPAEKAKKE
jgi:hypothetical protein